MDDFIAKKYNYIKNHATNFIIVPGGGIERNNRDCKRHGTKMGPFIRYDYHQ